MRTSPSEQYFAVHAHMRKYHPRVGRCEYCARVGATEYATKVKPWTRNRDDYFELCRRCHKWFDRASHCGYGHPFNEANAYRDKEGKRYCRACRARAARDLRKRAQAKA